MELLDGQIVEMSPIYPRTRRAIRPRTRRAIRARASSRDIPRAERRRRLDSGAMDTTSDRVARYFASRRPPGVAAAYLFGSHARGAPRADSDVDVGVVLHPALLTDRATQHRLALELASDLIATTHCNAVDVVVLNQASPELSSTVVTQGRRLYLADPEVDHQFRRTAQLRYADLRPFLDRTRRTKLLGLLG